MRKKSILLRNGLLIDGTGKEHVERVSIGIVDGKIESISESDINNSYDKVIDLNGLTILPGFINTHVHGGFKYMNKLHRKNQEEYLKKCIQEGVTTIRDEGMIIDDTIENLPRKLRKLKKSNLYPTIITTGKFFSTPKGYEEILLLGVTCEEAARDGISEVFNKDINIIKTVLEEGIDPKSAGLIEHSEEVLKKICDEAHNRGIKVSAHVTQAKYLNKLINGGIHVASHMIYDDLSDDMIDQMIEKNIYFVPTLSVLKMINDKFETPLYEQGKKNVFKFVQKGGKIGLGDDFIEKELPWYRLGMPQTELYLLKEAGLTNMQIIVAATKHGAEICSIDKELGTVEVGKKADLLIIEGNPLEDLDCINHAKLVIKDGVIVKNKSKE